jgi:hypothetical protein
MPLHINFIWKALSFEHCLFNQRLLNKLRRFVTYGLSHGVLFCDAYGLNETTPNGIKWYKIKIEIAIWEGLLDYNKFK